MYDFYQLTTRYFDWRWRSADANQNVAAKFIPCHTFSNLPHYRSKRTFVRWQQIIIWSILHMTWDGGWENKFPSKQNWLQSWPQLMETSKSFSGVSMPFSNSKQNGLILISFRALHCDFNLSNYLSQPCSWPFHPSIWSWPALAPCPSSLMWV